MTGEKAETGVGVFDPLGEKSVRPFDIDPLVCPLCQQPNHCLNLGAADVDRSCWCNDPAISFPESLLSQIPPEQRRKACVCRDCALRHQQAQASKHP